jgi:uncharacterized protein (PEP-CTERM system associated)
MGMRTGFPYLLLRPQVGVVCCLLWASSGFAAKWEGNASIAPSIAYTDNVCLTKDNKKGDWTGVGILTPSGSVSEKTRESSFSVHGSFQVNTLTDNELRNNGCSGAGINNRQQFLPNIVAQGSTQLIDNWMTLNGSLVANQNEVTSALPSSHDGYDPNGNLNTYYRYSISPTITHRLENYGKYTLKYSHDEQLNTNNAVSDSTRDAFNTSIASGKNSRISWSLSGDYAKTQYLDDVYNIYTRQTAQQQSTILKSASYKMGYQFSRQWQINGTYGWEWNQFDVFYNGKPEGEMWDVGMRWTPSDRTTVDFGSGQRFFGQTPRLNITHQYEHSLFRANYQRTITFQNDINTLGNAGLYGNTIENGLIQNPNNPFIVGTGANSSIYSNGPILDDRGTVGYTYTGRRATTDVYASYSEQTRSEDGSKAAFKNVTMTFSPHISRTYNMSASITWDEDEPLGYQNIPFNVQNFDKSSSWYYTLQVGRPINDRMSLSLNYQFTDRQSDVAINEYQENRFIATLNINL